MLKNITQHTQKNDDKDFIFTLDNDSNFNQVKAALIKMMGFFDNLETQTKVMQDQMKAQQPPPIPPIEGQDGNQSDNVGSAQNT